MKDLLFFKHHKSLDFILGELNFSRLKSLCFRWFIFVVYLTYIFVSVF